MTDQTSRIHLLVVERFDIQLPLVRGGDHKSYALPYDGFGKTLDQQN